MAGLHPLVLFFLPFFSSPVAPSPTSSDGVVGVIYAMSTPGLPPPKDVANALVAAGAPRVLLSDPYPEGVSAFNHTGIPIFLAINNTYLPSLANNETEAFRWVGANLLLSNITVETIAVGYSVINSHPELADYLLPALRNLQRALSTVGVDIPITTACNYGLITPGYPPSAAEFNKSLTAAYVKPLLEFLNATKSPYVTDAFPYRLYSSGAVQLTNTQIVSFDADEGCYLTDKKTGLTYTNLFEVMVDAVNTAMSKLGYEDIPVVVAGTGWPSAGGPTRPEASILFAAEYNEGLVVKLNRRQGTPMRPARTPVTYIYSLFDESRNDGEEMERNWGIWTPQLEEKYMIDFTPANGGVGARRPLGKMLLSAGGMAPLVLFWFLCE